MEQSRNVLRVIMHAEALLDPLADQRPSPHARLKPSRLRTGLDDSGDLDTLLLAQSGSATGQRSGAQTVGPFRVVPTGPLGDGRTVHVDFFGQRDRAATVDVAEHALGTAPRRQVFQNGRFTEKLPQSLYLSWLQS